MNLKNELGILEAQILLALETDQKISAQTVDPPSQVAFGT